jgi:hypothetical protein
LSAFGSSPICRPVVANNTPPSQAGYGAFVSALAPNDVFVFGSNLQGFHGAGSAGFASFGKPGNVWRAENYAAKPDGWQGLWNVKGIGEGLQEGTQGTSYALPTVVHAGDKLSINPEQMVENMRRMYDAAAANPDKRFLVAGDTSGRLLNGYTHEQMAAMYLRAGPIPGNVIFSATYTELLRGLGM